MFGNKFIHKFGFCELNPWIHVIIYEVMYRALKSSNMGHEHWKCLLLVMRFFSIFNNLGNKVPWLYKPYNHCPGPAYLAESAPKQRWQWKPDVQVESKTSGKQRLRMRLPLRNEMRLPLMIATDDWRKTKLKIKEQYRCKCQSTDWLGATQDCQQAAESFEPILLDTKWLTLSHKFKKLWIDLLKKKYMNCHI